MVTAAPERTNEEKTYELLNEVVLYESGTYRRVRQYFKGWHPELHGVFMWGLQGRETMIERDSIRPLATFFVNGYGK